MYCPNCNSDNIRIESVQENLGSTKISETKYRINVKKKHGIIWWIFIGFWWVPVKFLLNIILWPILAIPKAIHRVSNRGVVATSTGAEETVNHIVYKTICTCQNCGKTWEMKK